VKEGVIMTDNINSPGHYNTGNVEVIEIIEQLTEGMEGKKAFNLGNVIKYIFRHENKGGTDDLKKAAWYLNRVIDGDPENNEFVSTCLYCGKHYWSTRSTKVCAACRSKVGSP